MSAAVTFKPDHASTAPSTDVLAEMRRVGFLNLSECVMSVPRAYIDCTEPLVLADVPGDDRPRYYVLRVVRAELFTGTGVVTSWSQKARQLVLQTTDWAGRRVRINVFGAVFVWKRSSSQGAYVHVLGRLQLSADGALEVLGADLVHETQRGRIAAIYPGKVSRVKSHTVAEAVWLGMRSPFDASDAVLRRCGLDSPSEWPAEMGFATPWTLLQALHYPTSMEEGHRAAKVARVLSARAQVRLAIKARVLPLCPASRIAVSEETIASLVATLPFPLTADQSQAIAEIASDLRAPHAMARLLSGDVGTGKSCCFMVPAVAAQAAGAGVAIVAPSLLVVAQIVRELRTYFPGVEVLEVTTGVKLSPQTERAIHVGTTALVNAARKAERTFDFLVIDEQHKMSVAQRSSLAGLHTNVLEATATAIPRTQALVFFAGMSVSLLRQSPVIKRVDTHITTRAERQRLQDFLHKALERRWQVAVIYPLVTPSPKELDSPPLKRPAGAREAAQSRAGDSGNKRPAATDDYYSVSAAAQRWEACFPGRVGVLHGKLSDDEKAAVIAGMHEHRFDILISSIVIEVGVTLPSLKAMVVMAPHQYGAATLHQLRGRLARHGGYGHMFLHCDTPPPSDTARERLELVRTCSDGFELSDRDRDLRGYGDLHKDGEAQKGRAVEAFWGVHSTAADLKQAAIDLGLNL
jgi:ATP-dependent DNA helicase RecG